MTKSADTPSGGTSDTQCYSYDGLQRLTQAWTPASGDCTAAASTAGLGGAAPYWKSWTFDGSGVDASTGNRVGETTHASSGDTVVTSDYTDATHPHAVKSTTTKVGGTTTGTGSYTYDPNGDTLSRPGPNGAQALTWDPDGHLSSLTDTSGSYTYVYEADGDRLIQHDPNGTTLYLDGVELRMSTTGVKTATRYYTFNDQTVAQRTAAGVQFLTGDPHGTDTIAVDDTTTLTATHRYQDPYGNSRGASVTWTGTKAFVGGDQDPTGLIHEGAREYDSLLGRFISVDPDFDDSQPQSWNNYAYSNNNPVGFSDPEGTGWGWLKKTVSVVATVASVASIIPGPIGMVASGVAAGAYAAEGDYKDAAIAVAGIALSAVGAGAAVAVAKVAKAAKAAKGVVKGVEEVEDTAKVVNEADEAIKTADNAGKDIEDGVSACAHSFAPTTPVVMADGSAKPIKDVRVGDEVKSTDPLTGKTAGQAVTLLHLNHDTDLADVTVKDANGKLTTVHTTQHHPFWDTNERLWVSASDLKAGHKLKSLNGGSETVVSVRNYTGHHDMNDLTVNATHTYYIVAGATPVLVHNCDEVFYRAMSEKEFAQLGSKGEITVKHTENFVTQSKKYLEGLRRQSLRGGGRKAKQYTVLVRYEMARGTRAALTAAGRRPGEIGHDLDVVHLKMEHGAETFGLRPGSVNIFNSRILRFGRMAGW